MKTQYKIGRFRIVNPPHVVSQQDLLAFLVEVFAKAGSAQGELNSKELYTKLFERLGCNSQHISKRYTYNKDFLLPPEQWTVFDPSDPIALGGWTRRRNAFIEFTNTIFEQLFPEAKCPQPADIVHVTCTAYESPSAAQILASKRNWSLTNVTQVYHHGCYAVIPALRVASGIAQKSIHSVNVVHTELHTLHANPSRRTPDQIVGHSLFGDGVVAYELWDSSVYGFREPCLELLSVAEYIIPGTADLMRWSIVQDGMEMVLDKAIPDAIAQHINTFVCRLYRQAGLERERHFHDSIMAIHPGGPKILDKVRDALGIDEDCMTRSRRVLLERGNLSSATVPHIWSEILADPSVKDGTLVTSLAFGPGLTAAGALLRFCDA